MYIDIKIKKSDLTIETDAKEFIGTSCIEHLDLINSILEAFTVSETIKPEMFYIDTKRSTECS